MSNLRRLKDTLTADGRIGLVASGNPAVLHSAHAPIDINGRTPTNKASKVWRDGVNAATPVQHHDGKKDGKDIGRPRVVTW